LGNGSNKFGNHCSTLPEPVMPRIYSQARWLPVRKCTVYIRRKMKTLR